MLIGKKQDVILKKMMIMPDGCLSHDSLMRLIYNIYNINTGSLSKNRRTAINYIQPLLTKGLITLTDKKRYIVTNRAYQELGVKKEKDIDSWQGK